MLSKFSFLLFLFFFLFSVKSYFARKFNRVKCLKRISCFSYPLLTTTTTTTKKRKNISKRGRLSDYGLIHVYCCSIIKIKQNNHRLNFHTIFKTYVYDTFKHWISFFFLSSLKNYFAKKLKETNVWKESLVFRTLY